MAQIIGCRLWVCGGRDFDDPWMIDHYLSMFRIKALGHGKAPGADYLAGQWARTHGILPKAYPANWVRYGSQAGPIRNAAALKLFKPDIVLAFPGGTGTKDMCTKAEAAGVPVLRIKGWSNAVRQVQ